MPSAQNSNTSSKNQFPKLHAAIAQAGLMSRRKAETLIADGKVTVNGQAAHVGQRINPQKDTVSIEGKKIVLAAPKIYVFIVNKPKGIVSTTSDELGRQTIVEYLQQEVKKDNAELYQEIKDVRLYPVGRLDLESEGLMIMTNDGELTQKYTHPSFESLKTYEVVVAGKPTFRALNHLERGVRLKEGYTAPADITVLESNLEQSILEITIHEGRHQQVRRMCERVGYPVLRLTRVRMADYTLDDVEGRSYKLVSESAL